ncbi:MAG: aldo/keto reductase [Deltaproteobacteria bacterium]|nr:aldo/keto reductase [Deltaproteobacteria bacterium]
MQTTPLGSTGLSVSPIGIGLAALGRPGYITIGHADALERNYDVTAMESRAHRVLDKAYAMGVRYFDAARSYGRAEAFLASWLQRRGIPTGDVVVGSKWGYTYTAGWQVEAAAHEVKEHSLAVLQRQWNESQAHFGAHLDLYQIHSATLESGVLANREVLKALARLKSDGTAIGLSVSGESQGAVIDRALETTIDGVRLFDAVQATWNLLEMSAGPALKRAAAAGLGVIVKEALANGRLTEANQDPEFERQRALLRREARRLATTVDALAMAAALAQPWAGVVLSGAATTSHLVSNLRATDVIWDDRAAASLEDLVESPEVYWHGRDQLRWN